MAHMMKWLVTLGYGADTLLWCRGLLGFKSPKGLPITDKLALSSQQ